MNPTCARCGTEHNSFGRCQDETCPFSNCAQDDSGGWEGHPHHPGPGHNGPVAEVSQEVANAFSMNGLPNVVVQKVLNGTASDDESRAFIDAAECMQTRIAENHEEAESALDLAAADCGWNDRSRISVLLDFIAQRGLGEAFADYVNKRADEECKS